MTITPMTTPTTYLVTVRRILCEDTVVEVNAEDPEEAEREALALAENLSDSAWACYDASYRVDDGDVTEIP